MAYNPSRKDTYYYVDEYGMMLCRLAGDQGRADSIGRTILAAIAYYEEDLLNAILYHCIGASYPGYLKIGRTIYRHPDLITNNISRDHITYLLIGLKYFQRERLLKLFSEKLRWKISDFARFTPDMWCWMKGIAGSRLYLWLFYRIEIFWMRLMSLWNDIVRSEGLYVPEYPQDTYDAIRGAMYKESSKLLYPAYTLQILGWQLYVLPDSRSKRRLQRICLKMTGRYNYLVRLLFRDQTVTLNDVNNYKHMTAWRWGVNLDETNDRDTYIITDPNLISDNALETDLLRTVWYEFHPACDGSCKIFDLEPCQTYSLRI